MSKIFARILSLLEGAKLSSHNTSLANVATFCYIKFLFLLMISCYISFLFIVISESVISDSVIAISFFLLYQILFHQIPLYQFPFFGYISFRYIRVRYINFPFLLHQIPLYQFPEKMLHQIPLYQIPLYQLPHPRIFAGFPPHSSSAYISLLLATYQRVHQDTAFPLYLSSAPCTQAAVRACQPTI